MAREVEIGGRERRVVVAIKPREIGIATGIFLAGDLAVAVSIEPLARGVPAEPGLGHGRPEPAVIRSHRLVLKDGRVHVEPLRPVGPRFPHGFGDVRGVVCLLG